MTAFVPGPVGQIFVESVDCVLDVPITWTVPDDWTENAEQYWGWRVEVSDRHTDYSITRYVSLEESGQLAEDPLSFEGGMPTYFLCEDEMTGSANAAAPDKPFGEGLYWDQSLPGGGDATDGLTEVAYGSLFWVRVYGVSILGEYDPVYVESAIVMYEAWECEPYAVDVCCPEHEGDGGSVHDRLGCGDVFDLAACPVMYDTPKVYGARAKAQCGWGSDFAEPRRAPIPTFPITSSPTGSPTVATYSLTVSILLSQGGNVETDVAMYVEFFDTFGAASGVLELFPPNTLVEKDAEYVSTLVFSESDLPKIDLENLAALQLSLGDSGRTKLVGGNTMVSFDGLVSYVDDEKDGKKLKINPGKPTLQLNLIAV